MKNRSLPFVGSLALIGLLAGCIADTEVATTWSAPGVQSLKFKKVFVLAMAKDDLDRRTAETAIRGQIKTLPTVRSFEVLPDITDAGNKAKVIEAIKNSEADGLVVMRMLYKGSEVSAGPTASRPMDYQVFTDYWGTYYDVGAYYSTDPRRMYVETMFGIETSIFDAKTGKLLWRGQTKSKKSMEEDHDVGGLVSDVGDTIRRSLKSHDSSMRLWKNGTIPPAWCVTIFSLGKRSITPPKANLAIAMDVSKGQPKFV